jgi:hypothetical protein
MRRSCREQIAAQHRIVVGRQVEQLEPALDELARPLIECGVRCFGGAQVPGRCRGRLGLTVVVGQLLEMSIDDSAQRCSRTVTMSRCVLRRGQSTARRARHRG